MHKIYADLIIKGLKTIDDVPLRIRDKVKQELIKRGRDDLAVEKEK
jgi:hypothetical protein